MTTAHSYNTSIRLGFTSIGSMWLKCPCGESVRVGREAKVHADTCKVLRAKAPKVRA